MSDGERVALYLMAQCLCVPPDSIVIIDEPDSHLHKSLTSKLWSKIEEAQPNCLFIYITHDIDFAASRVGSRKIWLKGYDGSHWDWEEVSEAEDLPEEVFLEILGSRKNVLFVEGDKGSLDYKIYQAVYPDFLIIPCGGCDKVSESTKAMRDNSKLHHLKAFGIIDRDYKPKDEINKLKKSGIYPLEVAEVENLLCVPELLEVVANRLSRDAKEVYQDVSDFVINKVADNLEDQASKRSAYEIEFKLNMFDAKAKGEANLTKALKSVVDKIDVKKIYRNNYNRYQKIIDDKDYNDALLYYNNKGLYKEIAKFFDFYKDGYGKCIVRLLSTEHKDAIVAGLKKYTPTIE